MLVEFSHNLAKVRFQHRVTELDDGMLAYRLGDGSGHVRLSKNEWHDAGTLFNQGIRPSMRRANVELLLWIPAYVTYIAICSAVLPKSWAKALPSWLYLVLFVGPLFATPFLVYFRHSFHVKRVCAAIDAGFAKRPRVSAPARNLWRPPFWLDVLGLLFVGPHLILAIMGELDPNFFRNTPLTGTHVDWQAMLGFALIVSRIAWGAMARKAQAPQASR